MFIFQRFFIFLVLSDLNSLVILLYLVKRFKTQKKSHLIKMTLSYPTLINHIKSALVDTSTLHYSQKDFFAF